MPERYFNPENIQPEPQTEKEPQKENATARKAKRALLGALLAAGAAIPREAQASNIPENNFGLEPVSAEQGKAEKHKHPQKKHAKQQHPKKDARKSPVHAPINNLTPEKPKQVETKARGYPTRGLEGRYLGGLFSTYTGIRGRVPKFIDIDFKKQLNFAWNQKLALRESWPHTQSLVKVKKDLLAGYDEKKAHHVTLEEYEQQINGVLVEMKRSIDWIKVRDIKKLESKQLALLQAVVDNLDSKDFVAYSLTEFMPSHDGDMNAEVLDFLLRNAGEEYPYAIPATGDGLMSFGPYQMTDIAMLDMNSNRGALVIDRASTGKHIPKRTADLRGFDHHRAAFFLAVDNLANLLKDLHGKDLNVFANNWRAHRDELVEYMAVAHTASSGGLGIGKKWIEGGMKKPFMEYTYNRYTEYAQKTKNNLPALRKREQEKKKQHKK